MQLHSTPSPSVGPGIKRDTCCASMACPSAGEHWERTFFWKSCATSQFLPVSVSATACGSPVRCVSEACECKQASGVSGEGTGQTAAPAASGGRDGELIASRYQTYQGGALAWRTRCCLGRSAGPVTNRLTHAYCTHCGSK